jgi:prevent-host-death family protein
MQVAVRELKAHLSRILSRAQGGEPIEVTSHNRLIARIVGIPGGMADGLRAPVANGSLS